MQLFTLHLLLSQCDEFLLIGLCDTSNYSSGELLCVQAFVQAQHLHISVSCCGRGTVVSFGNNFLLTDIIITITHRHTLSHQEKESQW